MPEWKGSDRRQRLPPDWEKRRRRQLRKDNYQCQWKLPGGGRCLQPATEVDHINADDDHSELQSLCANHHQIKSAREGAAAANARRAQIKQSFRFNDVHPRDLKRKS